MSTELLQLEAEGRLSLDDSLEKWLPGVVQGNGNAGRAIPIRQPLNHTSGIYDPTTEPEFFAPNLERHEWGYVYTPAGGDRPHRPAQAALRARRRLNVLQYQLPACRSGDRRRGVQRMDVPCGSEPDTEPVSAWTTEGGGPGFTSVALTTANGERQLVLAVNVYDLGADLKGEPPSREARD
ncbi:serine hydrolase [Streptomyces sp. NPDC051218]|uniref:serine hydrolase n=1 Tax=Streptomyces sp. NPDC051218 TaxID=3365645 RepID=UPI00378CAF59